MIIYQDKLLYPEILWQRPINTSQKRGRVFILGGEKDFRQLLFFCEILQQTLVAKIGLGYPKTIPKTIENLLPQEMRYPLSERGGVLSTAALSSLKTLLSSFDLFVLGVGLSKNSQTRMLIRNTLALPCPILFYGEGIISFEPYLYQERKAPSFLVLEPSVLALWLRENVNKVQSALLPYFSRFIEKLQGNQNHCFVCSTVISDRLFIIAGRKGSVVVTTAPNRSQTKSSFPKEIVSLGLLTAFLVQNLRKPFEAIATASYLFAKWQTDMTQKQDLQKVITKVEKELDEKKS